MAASPCWLSCAASTSANCSISRAIVTASDGVNSPSAMVGTRRAAFGSPAVENLVEAANRMITDTMDVKAICSECGTYRYSFNEQWDANLWALPICMLNPATAQNTENLNRRHPTRQKCREIAQREGYGGIMVVNLFAARCQTPRQLRCFSDPFGSKNNDILEETAASAKALGTPILCAWGTKGRMFGADQRALDIFKRAGVQLVCLGKTRHRYPRHPLHADITQPLLPFP